MLSRELGHGIANLASYRPVGLICKALEQLGTDSLPLSGVEGEEQVGGLTSGCLPWFRRLAPEDDRGKSSCLHSVCKFKWSGKHGTSLLTEVSCASSICSDRPISSTSGRWATHSSFSCCSAAVRWTLSGDWRPCSSVVSAVCTSAGRTDMVGRGCGGERGTAPWSGGRYAALIAGKRTASADSRGQGRAEQVWRLCTSVTAKK